MNIDLGSILIAVAIAALAGAVFLRFHPDKLKAMVAEISKASPRAGAEVEHVIGEIPGDLPQRLAAVEKSVHDEIDALMINLKRRVTDATKTTQLPPQG